MRDCENNRIFFNNKRAKFSRDLYAPSTWLPFRRSTVLLRHDCHDVMCNHTIGIKVVFHFKRMMAYHSIFFCFQFIRSIRVLMKQRSTLRYATIRVKWKKGFSVNRSLHVHTVMLARKHSFNLKWGHFTP